MTDDGLNITPIINEINVVLFKQYSRKQKHTLVIKSLETFILIRYIFHRNLAMISVFCSRPSIL